MCSDINVFVVRQFMLLTAVCLVSFTSGVHLAFPSILNPAILALDADVKVTPDQASWIAASLGLGGLVGYTFIPVIFEVFGRKIANITTNLFIIVGSLIFYVANDVYTLVLARLIQGIAYGGSFSCIMTLCECVPPKRRGYFMVINKIVIGVGSLACHALGLIWNWRQIAVFGAIPNCLSIILYIMTAESPAFFANRVKFDKCEEAFKWYRGDSLNANKELKELVAAQKENFRMKQRGQSVSIFRKIKVMLFSSEFRKSFYIVTLATLCIDSCGRFFTLAYITQILLQITNNKSLAMYMSVVSDCILICALCTSSILVKYFKRRTLLFRLGFTSVFLMFLVSLTIILRNKISMLQDMTWLTPTVLFSHTFITNVGLIPIAFALTGEIFTLDQKGLGSFMSGFVFLFFFNVVIKITPAMIETTGVEGTYAIYGVCLLFFLSLLRIVLPETKDKTLQKIEDEIKGVVRKKSEVELINADTM